MMPTRRESIYRRLTALARNDAERLKAERETAAVAAA
jgi:hypothetical protein